MVCSRTCLSNSQSSPRNGLPGSVGKAPVDMAWCLRLSTSDRGAAGTGAFGTSARGCPGGVGEPTAPITQGAVRWGQDAGTASVWRVLGHIRRAVSLSSHGLQAAAERDLREPAGLLWALVLCIWCTSCLSQRTLSLVHLEQVRVGPACGCPKGRREEGALPAHRSWRD